jgi:hypothetical protein
LKQVKKREISNVSSVVKEINSEKKDMEQVYRASLIENDYSMALRKPEVNIMYRDLSSTSAESERGYSSCNLLPTEDKRRPYGIGYRNLNLKITTNAI